ncbi:MAG: NADP-dependent phosphogluconate dehydrogenase [Chloroflexi bacterium]|nr:NADP-dependent phosphogluconate dehydrogenase [Chloroflexota bacterium]
MTACDIGLIGLGVMGQNLVLNMADKGYQVAVYNRTTSVTEEFMAGAAADTDIVGTVDLQELVAALNRPRSVMLMVTAGPAVDAVIEQVKPHLEEGDIIIDGGNSHFENTNRRAQALSEDGIRYLGVGISGGEEGAFQGPSIMPGGHQDAYAVVGPIFEAAAAKVDGDPCVAYLGPHSAGHYVKMVHNGIEYGVMQAIAEVYHLLARGIGLDAHALHEVFAGWNEGLLDSYLMAITAEIFARRDDRTDDPLIDVILDKAKQHGTGRWTTQDALNIGYPVPTISAAVEARVISAYKGEREAASGRIKGPANSEFTGSREAFIEATRDALFAAELCTYAQGMGLLRAASQAYDYDLDLAEVARIWRGGCIIRAHFLDEFRAAYQQAPDLPNLLVAPYVMEAITTRQAAWREVVQAAVGLGIPTPALSSALAYFDSYRSAWLPANLIQAQRDYFGAHTYERIDDEGTFHTEWTPHQTR